MSQLSPITLAIFIVRVVSPILVFCSTLSLIFTKPSSLPPSSSPITSVVVATRVPRRGLILPFLSLSALTYLCDGLTSVVDSILQHRWNYVSGLEVNAIIGLVAFSGLAALGAWKDIHGVEVWFFKRVHASVGLSLALDIALSILVGLTIRSSGGPGSFPGSIPALLHLAFPAFRVLVLLPLWFALIYPRTVYSPVSDNDCEDTSATFLVPPGDAATPSTGLLTVPGANGETGKYGTFRPSRSMLQRSTPTTRAPTPAPSHKDAKPEITLDPSWSEIAHRFKRITPYLWPSKSRGLQFLAGLCIIVLLIGRFVNGVLPFVMGELIKIFENRSDRPVWGVLGVYVVLRLLQGSGGLNALRDCLWTPVMQYSDREMSQLSFNHLLNLSFSFHTRRKTGEILRVLDRGAAINHTLELILFNIVPTFIDIGVALVLFCVTFEWTLAVVIFFVMFAYVCASIIMTRWRTKIRRQMNERDILTRGIHTDCLLNYETVKYFCGEEHEATRYSDALREYQFLEYRVIMSLNLLNLVQNFIISLGLLVGSIIVANNVIKKQEGAAEFVIFITYLGQLYAPLNQLGYIYRSVNQSLIDTEKLLKLLNEPTEIEDKPGAPDLLVEDGEIEFENVSFSYDDRTTALNNVSFKVPKNSSIALVGESGAGKSTVLRLLYRFYDLKEGEGRILIDGKDIRDVTQKSLRQAIGVVPQDSVLFNTTIKYNIGYGKFGATDDEIEAATKSAQMHDRIMSFPDGYQTIVGERGVRLSGGEKQRVAIARTLLKNPPILLLDEATSALDTSTEKDIQKALQNLMLGRSSLSIAHRLSTIANADIILVLKDGQIVEKGSHSELLAQDGIFASMWADQISATDEPAVSIHSKRETTGYSVEPEPTAPSVHDSAVDVAEPINDNAAPPTAEEEPVATVPSIADDAHSVAAPTLPPKDDVVASQEVPAAEAPIAFPSSDSQPSGLDHTPQFVEPSTPAPVSFPSSDAAAVQSPSTPGGVTFEGVDNSRTGTPDPEGESKRRRIGSQNFQRLARRISITTRRQGSVASMIPGLGRKDKDKEPLSRAASTVTSTEEGEGSVRNSNDSPAASISDQDKKLKKKDKKKRKSLM